MRTLSRRLIGLALVITAIFGLLINLAGVAGVWWARKPVTQSLTSGVRLIITTLETTSRGLEVVSQSLSAAKASVIHLDEALTTLENSIEDTARLMDSLVALTGRSLPTTVKAAQGSLLAAQTSAQVLEGVLHAVTSIPFFPGKPYTPEMPLSTALGEVATSLDGLSASFSDMENGLKNTGGNLGRIQSETRRMAGEIRHIRESLENAQAVVAEYQTTTQNLLESARRLEANLPRMITLLTIALTVLLVGMGLTQAGLFLQGWDMLKGSAQKLATPATD
ncbi:hypothetical protein SE15_09210 [Thermanaerothrix daxensis]|uniref:Methyl-accepting transducer domain-containing protein n=1 Tax=Thermanaerothrix daxensis TaxID=869279 RepID=A0A0P6XTL9_9CHLR|nr:hypothetical protein [Thermanaerothrix daxensis]KPL82353.1 hypothetical protein SE15_09210 [Thermanaerothrix daxensis]